jgi:cyclohexyl-isocyanide hydratase
MEEDAMKGMLREFLPRRFALGAGPTLGLGGIAMGLVPAATGATREATEPPVVYGRLPKPGRRDAPLSIGSLVFPLMDQIDFTGPFEVFARIPNATVQIVAKTTDPVRDVKGLTVTPTVSIAQASLFDILHVAGGLGQQALMDDEEIMSLIRRHADANRLVFSVCTGALLCGAAGLLNGRQATTHWAALDLLKFYGASPVRSRVVVDGNYISTAGVTAGLDGALVVASLLRGDKIAEEIQLDIQYAPNPVFHSGTPEEAEKDVIDAFFEIYGQNKEAREREAHRFAAKLGVKVEAK